MHYAFLELEKYDNIEEDAFYDYFNVNPVQILQKSYEQSARDAKREVKIMIIRLHPSALLLVTCFIFQSNVKTDLVTNATNRD